MKRGRQGDYALKALRAFSLVELLVVVGIITVLAAIIFPVYARAKVAAMRNGDISRMNSIRSALLLYREDQGGFPPALLGYVNPYESGAVNSANVVPADQLKAALYPRRINSLDTLRPAMNRSSATETTHAVWPNRDPRPVGSAGILDLDGNGVVNGDDDLPQARQKFGPEVSGVTAYVQVNRSTVTDDPGEAANFYKLSGYDVAVVRTPNGNRAELRYSLFWTDWGLGGGNAKDDPRQLGYDDPPDSTVITWNSYFRDYHENGNPVRRNNDIVLFLGGGAVSYDSRNVNERAWRVMPR